MGFDGDKRRRMTSIEEATLRLVQMSFREFLRFWHFKNRETGAVQTMAELWSGQARFAELMTQESRILALKAGKLGFTELECAFDAWVALFSQANARVHLFSLNADAAQELLRYVRFGITHLPWYMQLSIMGDTHGGDTGDSLKLLGGPDDIRSIVSYAASPHAAIDRSATHSHVDELARMPYGESTWQSIQSTIAPGGSCHIVTRGAGDANFVASLWEQATAGTAYLYPFFAAYNERPDRDPQWREKEAASMNQQGVLFFAPETQEDALAGDETAEFLNANTWDKCYDPDLPPLNPHDRTAIVLGIDASVSGDCFAVVAVSRHPKRHNDPAIRQCKLWDPRATGGRIDFDLVERWIRCICEGGCANFHPRREPDPACGLCRAGETFPGHYVVQIVYDPYQMEAVAQRLTRQSVAWVDPCDQGTERLIADSEFHKYALSGRLSHDGDRDLREHVLNARAKLQKDEDSKLRMVKKAPNRKIDLAVAASMAIKRILYLNV
jgi:hypothetical protein